MLSSFVPLSLLSSFLLSSCFGSSCFSDTFTTNFVVNPPYVILIICVPGVVALNPDIIFGVTGIVVIPLDFTTSIVAPVMSKFSPYLYSVLSGSVFTDIPFILSSTFTWKFPCNPLYSTFIVCVPSAFGLYPVIMAPVIAVLSDIAPLAIIIDTFPPVNSMSSPYSYSTFVGFCIFRLAI